MRRNLFSMTVFFMLCSILISCASLAPIKDEDRTFSQVYEAPGQSKDELFDQGRMWIAETFKSAKAVIEYENKENGTIIGNGLMKYPCDGLSCMTNRDWSVGFTMKYETKDERFKLTFSNLTLSWPARIDSFGYHKANPGSPINTQGDLDRIRPVLLSFGEQIKAHTGQGASEKSDW